MITSTFTCVTKVSRQVNLLKEQSCSIEKLGDRVLNVDKRCVELEIEHDFKLKRLESELEAANASRLRAEQVRIESEATIDRQREGLEASMREAEEAVSSQREAEARRSSTDQATASLRLSLELDAAGELSRARGEAVESIAEERSAIELGLREELKVVNARLAVAMQSLKLAEGAAGGGGQPATEAAAASLCATATAGSPPITSTVAVADCSPSR